MGGGRWFRGVVFSGGALLLWLAWLGLVCFFALVVVRKWGVATSRPQPRVAVFLWGLFVVRGCGRFGSHVHFGAWGVVVFVVLGVFWLVLVFWHGWSPLPSLPPRIHTGTARYISITLHGCHTRPFPPWTYSRHPLALTTLPPSLPFGVSPPLPAPWRVCWRASFGLVFPGGALMGAPFVCFLVGWCVFSTLGGWWSVFIWGGVWLLAFYWWGFCWVVSLDCFALLVFWWSTGRGWPLVASGLWPTY